MHNEDEKKKKDVMQKLTNSKAAKDAFQKVSNVLRDWKISIRNEEKSTGRLCLV